MVHVGTLILAIRLG